MNLLITGAWIEAKEHISKIEEMGHSVVFLQQEKEELPCAYEWVEGVICNGLFLYGNNFEKGELGSCTAHVKSEKVDKYILIESDNNGKKESFTLGLDGKRIDVNRE